MYDYLYKTTRRFTFAVALFLLLALVIEPLGSIIGLDSKPLLAIFLAVICGSVLLERKLEKMMMAESWKKALSVDLEASMDQLYMEEKARRRKDGKPL